MSEMDDAIRRLAGRGTPSNPLRGGRDVTPVEPVEQMTSFDGGARESAPAEPDMNAELRWAFANRRMFGGEIPTEEMF